MEQAIQRKHRLDSNELPIDAVLFGKGRAMREVKRRADLLAGTKIPVLIRGESGTGKEVIAKYLHLHSEVSAGPFVKVNCAAIPSSLLESELFGHERGAFTGADQAKPGKVEQAQGGTLFLDEIGEMHPHLQTKLLHFLQDQSFCRIGGHEIQQAQVRVICATNCDLERAMEENNFRQDVFYRIDVIALQLPPLRERREDVRLLAEHFAARAAERYSKQAEPLRPETLELLQRWRWPGNIRELENWMTRYVVLNDQVAMAEQLRQRLPAAQELVHLKATSKAAVLAKQRDMILQSLDMHRWNRRKVAKDLQISYRALLYKIRETGIAE